MQFCKEDVVKVNGINKDGVLRYVLIKMRSWPEFTIDLVFNYIYEDHNFFSINQGLSFLSSFFYHSLPLLTVKT